MAEILTSAVTARTTFFIQTCCNCHVLFGMPQELEDSRRDDKRDFYCPNGHNQNYPGKTVAQRARAAEAERDTLRRDNDRLADDNMSLAKKNRSLRARAKAGMCSKCNRTFKNYASHMETKHGAKAKAKAR